MQDTWKINYFSDRFFLFALFAILVILAGLLRFYHLGDWSHGFDENYTPIETLYFFEGHPIPSHLFKDQQSDPAQSQFARLPAMIVAAYFVHWVDYRLFGVDEFGSRFLMAVMGSFCVGIIFLLGYSLFGLSGSLILAFLVLLFPDHILHSQNNRFYSQAFLCISVVLLLGGHIAVKRSVTAAIGIGLVSILMVLTHSLAGLIWGFVILGVVFSFLCQRCFKIHRAEQVSAASQSGCSGAKPIAHTGIGILTGKIEQENIPKNNILLLTILGIWSILLLVIAVVYIFPLARLWNNFPTTTVSPIHALLGLAFSLGWSLSMLCIPGWLFALYNCKKTNCGYWLIVTTLCGLAVFLLPFKISYLVHYRFLFSFPFLVILALFIDWVGGLIIRSEVPYKRSLCCVWIIFTLFSNIPSIASYYQDGNRYDWRAAYQYIREHWQQGDQVICFPLDANRYIPELEPKIPIRERGQAALQKIIDQKIDKNQNGKRRTWIPIVRNRYEPDEDTLYWLYNHTEYKTRFGKKRYDFEINHIELFLYHDQPRPLTNVPN
ncbi:MAG: hypothetical protein LBK06_02720 [Planctomycetaceae bacterium]|jgi:hypothetical protein|nr:hypothetical protein [Planctomycetaceae bacterium]